MEGVLRILVKLEVSAKLIPLIIFPLLFDAAAKLMPLRTFELFVLVALVRLIVSPLIVVVVADILLLLAPKTCAEVLLVADE